MSTKVCSRFFKFCLDLELLAKIKKIPGFYTLTGNSRSEQNKNPEHAFVDMGK